MTYRICLEHLLISHGRIRSWSPPLYSVWGIWGMWGAIGYFCSTLLARISGKAVCVQRILAIAIPDVAEHVRKAQGSGITHQYRSLVQLS
jgi:hypothetical protein